MYTNFLQEMHLYLGGGQTGLLHFTERQDFWNGPVIDPVSEAHFAFCGVNLCCIDTTMLQFVEWTHRSVSAGYCSAVLCRTLCVQLFSTVQCSAV